MLSRTFLILLVSIMLASTAALAQPISAGLKIGGPFTEAFSTQPPYFNLSSNFIIGPTVELNLPWGFGIEIDALYRRYKYDLAVAAANGGETSSSSWEFPVLLKKKLLKGPLRPYVAGGPTFGRLTDIKQAFTTNPLELRHRSNVGFTVGAGVEIRPPLVLRISPEIRWTGWANRYFEQDSPGRLEFKRSQALLIVGLTF